MVEVRLNTLDLLPASQCRVFITHYQPRFDFGDLDRFAKKRVVLAQRSIFPDTADVDQVNVPDYMGRMLKDFDPSFDYVVLSGDPLLQAIALYILGRKTDYVIILRHDNQMQQYWPFKLTYRS